MASSLVGIILGALIATLITIIIENLRRPRLKLQVIDPVDINFHGMPAMHMRSVRVRLTNDRLPSWARWMSRNAATQCHGTISFYHLDGQKVFSRSMPVRWVSSPEPVPMQVIIGDQQGVIIDPTRLTLAQRVDVYPGESEDLDIAVRLNSDDDCYGWSNESYFSNPPWRNPDWKLKPDRYLVKVIVFSAGKRHEGLFRLVNNVPKQDFRIIEAQTGDTVIE